MRRVVINMEDVLFVHAIAAALQNFDWDFKDI